MAELGGLCTHNINKFYLCVLSWRELDFEHLVGCFGECVIQAWQAAEERKWISSCTFSKPRRRGRSLPWECLCRPRRAHLQAPSPSCNNCKVSYPEPYSLHLQEGAVTLTFQGCRKSMNQSLWLPGMSLYPSFQFLILALQCMSKQKRRKFLQTDAKPWHISNSE